MRLFSTMFLLAVGCLLVHAGAPTQEMTSCVDGGVHRISCDYGVIEVQTVLYGREDTVTCSEERQPAEVSNTNCSLSSAVEAVKARCNGKIVCELSHTMFAGSDPCRGTFKYLQTTHTCIQAVHLVTCEHSLAQLQCAEGAVIKVHGADYGRRDSFTCSYGRPPSQLLPTTCMFPTSIVAERCNGKNSCAIKATNLVFGDPCYGTYKYLEVAYACEHLDANQKGTA